ncbi:MAG TPA: acetyl-CoA C-acetyltransferase [Archaeoglobaceae archaeon]|nr:acetyl-CoA C-acetyltransferase [Archaeoglobaceae archaeon]
MVDVVVAGAVRTPVGKFGGALKDVSAQELGAIAIKGLLKKLGLNPVHRENSYISNLKTGRIELEERYHDFSGTEIQIDEVIMGNVLQAALGQNPARQSSIYAGIPKETPALTVNKVCGSGLKAIAIAASSIAYEENEVVIAGGMESMSNAPYAIPNARWGIRMFNSSVVDLMVHDGLWEIFYGYHMGMTAENLAELYGITREEQDELAYESHMRAVKAIDNGYFSEEIVPVMVKQKKEEITVDTDEHPRRDTTLEKLSRLPPVFKKDGTVTAGNASGINDGASALLLMSSEKAEEIGLKPLARVVSYGFGALDPAYMGLGSIPAIKKTLSKAEFTLDDMDLIELNEAFAAQAIAVMGELEVDSSRVNVNGSGISLGHPIGATGARITTTLLHEMRRRKADFGLSALCIGGGMGFAMIFERV